LWGRWLLFGWVVDVSEMYSVGVGGNASYVVSVGVTISVLVSVTVPGTRVCVTVLVVDGVGMDRQEQAVEMYLFDHSLGMPLGLLTNGIPRFPSGAGADVSPSAGAAAAGTTPTGAV
jgi:hypothetical protein